MSEDAQPNDLRGRNLAPSVPSIRPARMIPSSHHFSSSARTSFKRPFDRSHVAASPTKRRKLENPKLDNRKVDNRRKIVRELPLACRKGQMGCNSKRKEFIVDETERLRGHGLKVLTHTIEDGVAVHFLCTQEDILNCFLAPSLPIKRTPQKERSQPKVERPPQILPPPNPLISTIPGPPRVFKSGTLSFSVELPVAAEASEERVVVNYSSGAFDTDLDHPMPVAELMFGKQGPPKPPSSVAPAYVSAPAPTPVSSSGSQIVKPPLQPRSRAAASVTQSVSLPTDVAAAKLPLTSQPTSSAAAPRNPSPSILFPSLPQVPTTENLPLTDSTSSGSATTLHSPPLSRDLESSLSDCYMCEPDGDEFRIPFRTPQDKLRRFLCGTSPSSSIVVSMHGTLEGVDVASRKFVPHTNKFFCF
ncbi:hypothetical protein K438DRAFT_1709338 [Mycena galopus ATCC 62051]|nr:hypothetical protein K438DRAFT_1709338 [Mycena galopus ATCC 62051]